MKISRLIKFILGFPKTLYINLKYLSLIDALRLPIVCAPNVSYSIKGSIKIMSPVRPFMIRLGFHEVPICNPNDRTLLRINDGGILIFKGDAHLGKGTKISIEANAILELGDNFAISASSAINCYKRIVFGRDIQFSWDCLVMDSDTHVIYDRDGSRCNDDKEIIVGNKVWVGCRSIILKGSVIPDNCVIGASSIVCNSNYTSDSIIVGIPAKMIKSIGGFRI